MESVIKKLRQILFKSVQEGKLNTPDEVSDFISTWNLESDAYSKVLLQQVKHKYKVSLYSIFVKLDSQNGAILNDRELFCRF